MKDLKERIHNFFVKRAVVLVILALILAAGLMLYRFLQEKQIDSFEECAKAGNPVMESYPAQCRANGKTFVEP